MTDDGSDTDDRTAEGDRTAESDGTGREDGERLDAVALPITVPREAAVTIMEELDEGRTVEAEFDPERMPHLADRIRWQLEHERLVTEFVPAYETEGEAAEEHGGGDADENGTEGGGAG